MPQLLKFLEANAWPLALASLVQFVVFLRWIYRRIRNDELTRAFVASGVRAPVVAASGDLDEWRIAELRRRQAPLTLFPPSFQSAPTPRHFRTAKKSGAAALEAHPGG